MSQSNAKLGGVCLKENERTVYMRIIPLCLLCAGKVPC